MLSDMGERFDRHQYGNEKGMSLNHLLINMIHKILTAVDKNSAKEKFAVVLTMVDWSQAFERQNHKLGIQSFIDNGVRSSLIPILISFFKNREIVVKWNGTFSQPKQVTGGGPQGGTAGGILEYLSQSANNLNFLKEDEGYKFIDDASFLEIINLLSAGLASFNAKARVPSDMDVNGLYLSPDNFQTQNHFNTINDWTHRKEMKLNSDKTKYMLVNFCHSSMFQTRLSLENSLLEQVRETKLLGVTLTDDMNWHKKN